MPCRVEYDDWTPCSGCVQSKNGTIKTLPRGNVQPCPPLLLEQMCYPCDESMPDPQKFSFTTILFGVLVAFLTTRAGADAVLEIIRKCAPSEQTAPVYDT